MIDIHSHVLPGMDDGAKDPEESRELINVLQDQGVTLLVLTPHYYPHQERLSDFLIRREKAYQSISDSDIEMILASETYLSEPLLSYDSIEALCIGDTGYLLLELPYLDKWGSSVMKQIEQLIAKYNVKPIIAHIERYERPLEHRKEQILKELVDMGCLLQFNIYSVINKRTRASTLKLLKDGWADTVGSDCHNMTTRPPRFDEFYDIVNEKLGVRRPQWCDLF
ncbi:MAG: tyrosine-protein phosphatase [Anaerovoracaceae bacterium]|jgi:protein-tyrosine phosphatase